MLKEDGIQADAEKNNYADGEISTIAQELSMFYLDNKTGFSRAAHRWQYSCDNRGQATCKGDTESGIARSTIHTTVVLKMWMIHNWEVSREPLRIETVAGSQFLRLQEAIVWNCKGETSVSMKKPVYWRCQVHGCMPRRAAGVEWSQSNTREKLCILKVAEEEW